MSPVVSESSEICSLFAATTFFARCHPVETCGSNGLPLTPYSIAILGRAQILKTFQHNNLCQYLDIIRGKHERTIIVSQYFGKTLCDFVSSESDIQSENVIKIAVQIVEGLNYVHQHGMVHRNLSPENILVDSDLKLKLFNYGLYYMTADGKFVSFPIGYPKYTAPEVLLAGPNAGSLGPKGDIWSFGIIILELALGCNIWQNLKINQVMRKILSLIQCKNVAERIAREHNCYETYQALNPDLKLILETCLSILPVERPDAQKLLQVNIFNNEIEKLKTDNKNEKKQAHPLLRCDLKKIYCWWQLAGGDIQAELKRQGLLKNRPPILSLPNLVLLNGITFGISKDQSSLYDSKVVHIPLTNLISRLKHVKHKYYYPLIHCRNKDEFIEGSTELPLIIREKDTEYQFHRVVLFARLLEGYPYTKDMLIKQAAVDIPPLFRGEVWACLLGVSSLKEKEEYQNIDKETPTPTDRQIEVDIPRCHQYNELLSSPVGHSKLKRLLKAWILKNPQFVYWQGLDSLTAPFLYLNFNNEALAFASLSRFIPKYLHKFFLRDNSLIIKEYLSKFSQLTAFHEPELATHLHSINFIPELFAIPWFLTMFSHVFPLHKILHLWDKLLLGDSSFPLYIGLSILKQLKTTLMASGFNECILLFSDLPEVDIETCVVDSMCMYNSTPRSILHRQHEINERETDEYDISGIELHELQTEFCPRISTNDFLDLLMNKPERLLIVDIRSIAQFGRACVDNSINIPFPSVELGNKDITTLGVHGITLSEFISNRNVVVLSPEHNNAELFSRYLVECGVRRVCMLHGGFNILYSVTPNILHAAKK